MCTAKRNDLGIAQLIQTNVEKEPVGLRIDWWKKENGLTVCSANNKTFWVECTMFLIFLQNFIWSVEQTVGALTAYRTCSSTYSRRIRQSASCGPRCGRESSSHPMNQIMTIPIHCCPYGDLVHLRTNFQTVHLVACQHSCWPPPLCLFWPQCFWAVSSAA